MLGRARVAFKFPRAVGATAHHPHLFRVDLVLALPRVDLLLTAEICPRFDKQVLPEFPLKQWTRESPSSSPPAAMESWGNLPALFQTNRFALPCCDIWIWQQMSI